MRTSLRVRLRDLEKSWGSGEARREPSGGGCDVGGSVGAGGAGGLLVPGGVGVRPVLLLLLGDLYGLELPLVEEELGDAPLQGPGPEVRLGDPDQGPFPLMNRPEGVWESDFTAEKGPD